MHTNIDHGCICFYRRSLQILVTQTTVAGFPRNPSQKIKAKILINSISDFSFDRFFFYERHWFWISLVRCLFSFQDFSRRSQTSWFQEQLNLKQKRWRHFPSLWVCFHYFRDWRTGLRTSLVNSIADLKSSCLEKWGVSIGMEFQKTVCNSILSQVEANHVVFPVLESSLPKSCYVSGVDNETQASMTTYHDDSHECKIRETSPQEEGALSR